MTTDFLRGLRLSLVCLATLLTIFADHRPALAWDEEGHVIVTHLAVEAMPKTMPDWLRTPEVRSRLVYLSTEPDRWRGQHNDLVDHFNNPDHYFDEELLAPYGLTITSLPRFRREFTDLLAARRALHPEKFPKYDRAKDPSYTRLSPGMLPYRIAELQWQIAASWTTLKTYEQYPDLASPELVRNARENIVFHMGLLSHYVGDGAQPLHTTEHHNGWTGPNPKGYTTDRGFHQLIDGGLIERFGIAPESLSGRTKPARAIKPEDYWRDICGYLHESHELVEPLYAMEKSGDLYKPEGKRFIEERLLEGGAMLAGVWSAAHDSAVIDDFRVNQLKAKKKQAGAAESRPRLP